MIKYNKYLLRRLCKYTPVYRCCFSGTHCRYNLSLSSCFNSLVGKGKQPLGASDKKVVVSFCTAYAVQDDGIACFCQFETHFLMTSKLSEKVKFDVIFDYTLFILSHFD